jgi:hypothetical protein
MLLIMWMALLSREAFFVGQRDTYHFDIFAKRRPGYVKWYLEVENPRGMAWPLKEGARERAFRIRGEPGEEIVVYDERWDPKSPARERQSANFYTVAQAMGYIMSQLVEGMSV